MTLETEVQARYSSLAIVARSNPDEPSFLAVDATRLANAVLDVQADFEVYAQEVFDLTKSTHVSIGTDGVVAKLTVRFGQAANTEAAFAREEKFKEALRDLAKIGPRGKVLPRSTAQDDPEPVQITRDRFRDLNLRAPRNERDDLPSRLQ